MLSRRAFAAATLASIGRAPGASRINSTIGGVRIGASGYSFKSMTLDGCIDAMQLIGLGACEVWFRHIEPKMSRDELRTWRETASLEPYRAAGARYRAAGIEPIAFTYDMKEDYSDMELDRGFAMAKAVGAPRIATSTTFKVLDRLLPLMERHKMEVAFHGHTESHDPNQFAGPDSFLKVLTLSPYAKVNLDIGQFVGAGFDPLPFIKAHHANITVLHIRDGKYGQKTKPRWGTGDVPIGQLLQLVQREKYPMIADIECDYPGDTDTVAEVTKCFQFVKEALAGAEK